MLRDPWVTAALVLATFAHGQAQQPEAGPVDPPDRPKIALVLGGGGARGLAHVGVLEVLERNQVPVDFVVGTSMGALVGGLYASGWSPKEMRELVEGLDWAHLFEDTPARGDLAFRRKRDADDFLIKLEFGWRDGGLTLPPGLILGQNVSQMLDRATLRACGATDFDDLPIPFRCVAADLGNGSRAVLGSGNLADAMRASMSIPGVFAPAVIDGQHLIDGGIVENLPVSVAKDLGADIVIAIDVGTPLETVDKLTSLFSVTGQVAGIMMQQNVQHSLELLGDEDVLLVVPLGDVQAMDFAEYGDAIRHGRDAAEGIEGQFAALGIGDADWSDWLAGQRRSFEPPAIDRVVVVNHTRLADDIVRSPITQPEGATLDLDGLDASIDELTGLTVFDTVRYDLRPVEGTDRETELVVEATERSWGPHYFRFGLGLEGDFRGDNEFGVSIRHTWLPANSWGGEWRNDLRVGSRNLLRSEFYQPLDDSLAWFVAPAVEFQQRIFQFIEDGQNLFEADAYWVDGRFAVGRVLGNWGEVRVAYHRVEGSAKPNFGLLGEGDRYALQDGYVEGRFSIDTLDSLTFARHGVASVLSARYGDETLGASDEYSAVELGFELPLTFGDTTLLPRVEISTTVTEGDTAFPLYALGGFLQLSGLRQDELVGRHSALAALIAYHRLNRPASRFSNSVYVGASAELGNAWLDRDEIDARDLRVAGSVFLGIDSLVGPIYVAFGASEGGNYAGYLHIGLPF